MKSETRIYIFTHPEEETTNTVTKDKPFKGYVGVKKTKHLYYNAAAAPSRL